MCREVFIASCTKVNGVLRLTVLDDGQVFILAKAAGGQRDEFHSYS